MSKFLKPCYYEGRALENQWMNNVFQSHDLICGCLDPVNHLNFLHNQQKCPRTKDTGTTTEETTGDAVDLPIDTGDLEKLFEEDGDDADR